MLEILRTDFARIPELLALPAPEQPAPVDVEPVVPEPALAPGAEELAPEPERNEAQLGLF